MTKRYRIIAAFVLAAATAVALLVHYSSRILRHELEAFLGKGFAVRSIELHWGSVTASGVSLSRPDGKKAFSADGIALRADFLGLLRRQNTVSSLTLEAPYFLLETDRKGEVVLPLAGKTGGGAGQPGPPLLIQSIEINNGALDYLDGKVASPPWRLQLSGVRLRLKAFTAPPRDAASEFDLAADIAGRKGSGRIESAGSVNLLTKDTKCSLHVRNLDITLLKPYYHKAGDADITGGRVDLKADIVVHKSRLDSSGRIVLRDLTFGTGGSAVLGVPRSAVISLLKDKNNEIVLDFTLDGDLSNPHFNIRDSLMKKITVSLAKTLGLPIESIGKSLFELGGSAVKKIFK